MYKSKKNSYKKIQKCQTKKMKGGQTSISNNHPGIIGPVSNLVKNSANTFLSKTISGASKTLSETGELFGIDNNKLKTEWDEKIKMLSDPNFKDNITEVVKDGAKVFALGLAASQPAIDQLVESTTKAVEKSASKIGNASVSIALNTLTEIPILGILIGTIRSLDKGAQAVQSAVNAGSEVITATGDAASEVAQNIKDASQKLKDATDVSKISENLGKSMKNKLNEKTQKLLNKVGGSISEFHETTLVPEKMIMLKEKKQKYINNHSRTRKRA